MVFQLQHNEDFERLLETSRTNPVLIFKHSTQCPISSEAYQEFQRFAASAGNLPCGLILVVENRELSNTVASRLGIRHESPQAIIVRDGLASWNASHWSITADSLSHALR